MINIIVAIARNNAIGYKNQLIYHLSNDLKRFKALTTGHTIIMGRKTFESLPKGALPNRRNIVLSRQKDIEFAGAEHFTSLEEALNNCKGEEDIYIIGGETLYREAMPMVDVIYATEVDDTPENADAFFPEIDKNVWVAKNNEAHETDEKHAQRYTFVDYIKK